MRVYDSPVALDYQSTEKFFSIRGQRLAEVGTISAVLYQDQNPELASLRSAHEIDLITPKLCRDGTQLRVLDLGCGTGRWAQALDDFTKYYIGLDFCEDFLNVARNACKTRVNPTRFKFYKANLAQHLPDLVYDDQFDAIIIAGILLYLNDDDAERLLDAACGMLAESGVLYLREPLGLKQRLSLRDHYSAELKAEYSSLYRSKVEFESMLLATAKLHKLTVNQGEPLYPTTLDNRSETRQFYYVLERC
jgi:ubiquinone/menaquinone biosynthesis C-methylase UbiE